MRVIAFPKVSDRNPYTVLLYSGIEKLGVEVVEFELGSSQVGDVLHVHWPDWFFGRRNPLVVLKNANSWMSQLKRLQNEGTKIVWTAHNLQPHEARHAGLQRKFWSRFIPMVDGCVCLSEVSMRLVRDQWPALRCPMAVVPHGHYRSVYPMDRDRATARGGFGIAEDETVFAHVGMVRPYKNVPSLVRAFRNLDGPFKLLIAGEVFDEGLVKQINDEAGGDIRIEVNLQRVEDERLQDYFRAADVAVFPYKQILNSGSALMALSFDTPVLVPNIGSMPELRATIGTDWVMTYDGELTTQTLEKAAQWARQPRASKAPLDGLDWDKLAEKTVAFYTSLIADRPRK